MNSFTVVADVRSGRFHRRHQYRNSRREIGFDITAPSPFTDDSTDAARVEAFGV